MFVPACMRLSFVDQHNHAATSNATQQQECRQKRNMESGHTRYAHYLFIITYHSDSQVCQQQIQMQWHNGRDERGGFSPLVVSASHIDMTRRGETPPGMPAIFPLSPTISDPQVCQQQIQMQWYKEMQWEERFLPSHNKRADHHRHAATSNANNKNAGRKETQGVGIQGKPAIFLIHFFVLLTIKQVPHQPPPMKTSSDAHFRQW